MGRSLGVNFKDLVPRTQVNLRDLAGRSIAVDAYNALYQFLAIIRQPNGTPLKDSEGNVTSHLSGILYRTSNLVEMGIKVSYVFDGKPPALKEIEIRRRMKTKRDAVVKYEQAIIEGKTEEARTYAQATSQLKNYMEQDCKRLLTLMGVPWVQAPGEGEAQAAYMTKKGNTNFCASQDYDSVLFGAPTLIRNVTISGRRKLPRKPVYVKVVPEIVELNIVLKELDITHEQLVDVGILIGTDYNPDGVKGIGIMVDKVETVALDMILEDLLGDVSFPVNPKQIRNLFLNPNVRDDYTLEWQEPDTEGVVDFLCRERDFSEGRVRKALERMKRVIRE